ncbi:MAG TPA: MerR family transcriptional regulator [Bacteroidia bacterium]|jgi:DNA-binding transcriptional MerR regulator|nr:MerR family transcriptional regulator [Bacteroidia bacterium]
MEEENTDKLFYTITEVADMFKVNASLIRFWEKEFDVLKPRKSNKGNRLYTKKDIENLRVIYHLVKEKGFTLQGAKEKLKEKPVESHNKNLEAIEKLERVKTYLLDLKKRLAD